jgi:hypothetical protein
MIERIENSKQESDSAYYHDLMYLGEMLTKTVTSAIISGISNDLDRNQYRLLHRVVRADGIGEWSSVLDDALTGVPSQFLQSAIRDYEQRELTQKVEKGEWQFDCVEHLLEVFKILDLQMPYDKIPKKISGKTWFSHFSQLRNKKAHGALLPSICGEASKPLENTALAKSLKN